MRVLGIDPGTQYLGVGIVQQEGRRLVHVAHELLTPKDFDSLPDKLNYIFDNLNAVIHKYQPEAVSIENVFHGKNAKSAIVLAHARAVAILAAARNDLPVHEYAPSQVKRAVGASGQAAKDVVTQMVCAILGIKEVERADCSDALAIAICHLNKAAIEEKAAARSALYAQPRSVRRPSPASATSTGVISRQPRRRSPSLASSSPASASQEAASAAPTRFTIVRREGPAPATPRPAIVRKR